MKNVNFKLERRVSIFDIEIPFLLTEKRYSQWLEELKKEWKDERRRFITDTTVRGEFVYGNVNNRAAKNIRVEVDSRFISDEEVLEIIIQIFREIK